MAGNQYDLITKFKVDMGNFKSEMGNAQKTIGGTESGLKKLAGAAAVAFSATAVVGFAKTAIETTARLQAMDAQYAQVFKDQSGVEMMARLKDISGDANIQIDRLVGSANKFGAQLKGAGVEGAQAMAMTETATRLAADSAAFYDTSMEEATGSISSFLKGNFAAGDAIGVFTNATQMSDAATARFGKSWQDLSEAQKQTLLLEKVEETYKLSGAMGQAARESQSWENITGNLKATWDRFLTVVGGPLLQAVTPIIMGITDVIGGLQAKFDAMDFSFFDTLKTNLQFLKDGIAGVGDPEALEGISAVFYGIGEVINTTFTTIKELWDTTLAPALTALQTALVENLGPAFDTVFTTIKTVAGGAFETIAQIWDEILAPAFEGIRSFIEEDLGPVFDRVFGFIGQVVSDVFTRIGTVWTEILQPAFNAIIAFIGEELVPIFNEYFPVIEEAVNLVFTEIEKLWNNTLLPVFDAVVAFIRDDLGPIFARAFPLIKEAVEKAFAVIKTVWETILKPVFQGVMKLINDNLMPAFQLAFPIIKNAVEIAFNRIKWLWDNVLSPALDAVMAILNDKVKPLFEKVFPAIQSAVDLAFTAIKTVWETVLKPAFDAVSGFIEDVLGPLFARIFPEIQAAVETAFDNVGLAVDTVKSVFDGIKLTIDNVIQWFTDLKTNITNTINGARDAVDTAITKIKGFFDFNWSLPKLSLPKVSIEGKFSLAPPQVPKFAINWNAAGAIFTAPTILPSSRGLQGVGEAGPEAILPIKRLPDLLKPYFVRRNESATERQELRSIPRPMEVILKMGRQEFRAHIADITHEQNTETQLALNYY